MEAGKYVRSGEVGSYHVRFLSKLLLLEWNVVSENLLWPQGPMVWRHTFVWKCKCNEAKLYLTFFPKWCLWEMAASGCTLLDSPHLLKHVKKKIVCLSFNCCQPFSLFVMHEFIYLLVFVSKRVETALRDKANLTEGDMVLSKEKRFRNNFG